MLNLPLGFEYVNPSENNLEYFITKNVIWDKPAETEFLSKLFENEKVQIIRNGNHHILTIILPNDYAFRVSTYKGVMSFSALNYGLQPFIDFTDASNEIKYTKGSQIKKYNKKRLDEVKEYYLNITNQISAQVSSIINELLTLVESYKNLGFVITKEGSEMVLFKNNLLSTETLKIYIDREITEDSIVFKLVTSKVNEINKTLLETEFFTTHLNNGFGFNLQFILNNVKYPRTFVHSFLTPYLDILNTRNIQFKSTFEGIELEFFAGYLRYNSNGQYKDITSLDNKFIENNLNAIKNKIVDTINKN